jgi:hypothetical protein
LPFRIQILQEAQSDIQHAYDWYENQLTGLGERFLSELYEVLDKIGLLPLSYGIAFDDIRDAALKKFPYLVFFQVEGKRFL